MTYPNQPQGYYPPAQPQHPAQPGPYAQPQPGPGYPPAPPQPGPYGQPQPGYYPAQPQQQYTAPQPPPPVHATVDDYFNQPAGGSGKSLSSFFVTPGQSIAGIVARPITGADIQQQTSQGDNRPLFHKDNRPKLVMIVPLETQPSQMFPDGRVAWYVKGQAQQELARAMAEAGAPAGAPEAGAQITITFTGTREVGGGRNPQKLYAVIYRRPAQAGQFADQQQAPAPAQAQYQAPAQVQYQAQPQYQAPQPAMAQPQYQAPAQPQNQQLPGQPAQPAFEGQGYGQGFGVQPPAQPPAQPQQPYGMASPGQQVQQAADAATAAAQNAMAQQGPASQAPQQVPQGQPLAALPNVSAGNQELLSKLLGQAGAPAPAQAQ